MIECGWSYQKPAERELRSQRGTSLFFLLSVVSVNHRLFALSQKLAMLDGRSPYGAYPMPVTQKAPQARRRMR
jgi:hypothetical protein